jgi:DNA glycosylase AlkZ-like
VFPGTVLVDGFAAGSWRIGRSRGAATLTVEPFEPIKGRDLDDIASEGERLLAFAAPEAEAHDLRFGP